jgi:hypothetical protein
MDFIFSTAFVQNSFHANKHFMSSGCAQKHVDISVKLLLLWCDINQDCNVLTNRMISPSSIKFYEKPSSYSEGSGRKSIFIPVHNTGSII